MKLKKILLLVLILSLVLWGVWEFSKTLTNYYLTRNNDILIESPEFINNYFPEEYLNITKVYFIKSSCLEIKKDFCLTGEYTYYNKIYIAVKNPREEVIFNIYHEMGHHIWRYYLTEEERLGWEKYYNLYGGITDYSVDSKDANEDFAEYYALLETNFKSSHYDRRVGKERILNEVLKNYPKFDLRSVTK